MNHKIGIPELRFQEFQKEWKKGVLNDYATFFNGKAYKQEELLESGKYPVLRVGNLFTNNNWYYSNLELDSNKYIENDDLIYAWSASFGPRIWKGEKVIYHYHIWKVECNFKLINRLFYFQILDNETAKMKANSSNGFALLHITKGTIENWPINIPTLPEQQKIASFLSAVDEKIQQLSRKKELLEQYKKVLMQQLFSGKLRFKDEDGNDYADWEEKKFKKIVLEYRLGGNYTNTLEETEYPLIKMGNIGRGKINIKKLEYIPIDEVIDSKDRIQYGDLFFNTRNTLDLVGKVSIWRNELPEAYYNSNLMYLKFDNNLFMNYRLNSYDGLKGLKRFATGTTSVAAIYTKDLLKLKLNIPCLQEQQKIANFLSSIDAKIESTNQQINQMQSFKKGLLQQMFV
jgi:type I restriction enzyme S subunit